MKKIIAALMAAATAHPGVNSSPPGSSFNMSISPANPPVPSPTFHMPIQLGAEFSNRTIGLDPRDIQERDRADEFTCKGVEYFEPDIEIECVVHRRTTEIFWNYMFYIKISPAGLAYSPVGIDRWYAHFVKTFVDQWDSDTLGDMPKDGKWYESITAETWTENNWGSGMRIQSGDTRIRRLKAKVWGPDEERDDPHFEELLGAYLKEMIPKTVCEDEAGSINWSREEKCTVRWGVDFSGKDE